VKKPKNQTELRLLFLCVLAAVGPALAGCQHLGAVGEAVGQVGVATGTMSEDQAKSLARTTEAVAKTFADITPEQEYYIGRAVTASILKTYKPYNNTEANRYLNLLGQTLAQASGKPETFGGYHFLLLDSDDINAFAAPGGFIVITRGMAQLCKNEDELAAVLAHEIGHVENSHGLKAIQRGRLTSALTILATESVKTFGGKELAELTQAFEGSINDITTTMMVNGYSRGQEMEADQAALTTLKAVGYNRRGLANMLAEMKTRLKPGGLDFAKTHPDPNVRIKAISGELKEEPAISEPAARGKRFGKAMGKI